MPKRLIITSLGYTIFIVLPFLYMLMTIHHLLTTEMSPITRMAAAQSQAGSVNGTATSIAN